MRDQPDERVWHSFQLIGQPDALKRVATIHESSPILPVIGGPLGFAEPFYSFRSAKVTDRDNRYIVNSPANG